MTNTATLDWALRATCPKCDERFWIEDDDDNYLATKIFNNRWNEVKGYDCTCTECGHEFILDGVEY